MSDGGIQKGYTFWASIRITGDETASGEKMSKEKLQGAMDKIREILKGVGGDVVHCVQMHSDGQPVMGVEMRQSPKYRAKHKKP
jgi:hypothetical protein